METEDAIETLAALAQPTRLEAFRMLVQSEQEGVPAGELARALSVPQNTLSAHLTMLAHAELVRGERSGRQIVYHANLERVRSVALYLLKDCCAGRAEICAPLATDLAACCEGARSPRRKRG